MIRFSIVGIGTNLAGYCVYLLLTAFVFPPKLTMTILYTIGAVLGFIGNRRFTFDHKGKLSQATMRYSVVHLLGWGINYALLYTFVDKMGYPHQLIQAIAVVLVAGYLFIALRYIVFPAHTPRTKDPPYETLSDVQRDL